MTVKGALSLTNNQYQEAVKKAVRPKFRGNRPLPAKTTPQYPQSAEREYRRIAGAYMRLLNEELKKKLPAMMNEYKRERRGDSRLDDSRDLDARIRQMLQEVSAALEKRIAQFGLDSKIQQIAKMTQNTSVREWKRAVKDTLGIDILDDYYSGELYEQAIQRWIAENVAYIKSLPTETLGNMRQIILDGYLNGRPIHHQERPAVYRPDRLWRTKGTGSTGTRHRGTAAYGGRERQAQPLQAGAGAVHGDEHQQQRRSACR